MCGIAGIFDLDGGRIDCRDLAAMSKAIEHRGPDDEGYVLVQSRSAQHLSAAGNDTIQDCRRYMPSLENAGTHFPADLGLVHRRFSIIDLSAGGHQPFVDRENGIILVFNGEIYNYIELKEELRARGVLFRTNSDTEVLIKAYHQWGADCFRKFNGFWSLALYNLTSRELLLSRDRLGKKPLFWTRAGTRFIFASEIKALLAVRDVDAARDVEASAIYPWLRHRIKDNGEGTFFKDIFRVPPGSFAHVQENFRRGVTRFWKISSDRHSTQSLSADRAADELLDLLENSVALRLRADVPIGCELSGGLDSSAILALATGKSGKSIDSYTVRVNHEGFDEEPYARAVANKFSSTLHTMEVTGGADFWREIKSFTFLEEEPYHDPNLETNQRIWEWMRSNGIKVSLNGAAADELFAGYSYYFLPAITEELLTGQVQSAFSNLKAYSEGNGLFQTASSTLAQAIRFSAAHLPGIDRAWAYRTWSIKPLGTVSRDHRSFRLSKRIIDDFEFDRIPYWLTSGDRGYMGVPLEVRAPFLDHRLVEFSLKLPIEYLIRDGWHKWILRRALERILPPEIVWRRKKLGFPFPLSAFFKESAIILDYVRMKSSNPFVQFQGQIPRHWPTISFILWYEYFIAKNMALFDEIEELANGLGNRQSSGYRAYYRAVQSV